MICTYLNCLKCLGGYFCKLSTCTMRRRSSTRMGDAHWASASTCSYATQCVAISIGSSFLIRPSFGSGAWEQNPCTAAGAGTRRLPTRPTSARFLVQVRLSSWSMTQLAEVVRSGLTGSAVLCPIRSISHGSNSTREEKRTRPKARSGLGRFPFWAILRCNEQTHPPQTLR